jgi:hypothetical protein
MYEEELSQNRCYSQIKNIIMKLNKLQNLLQYLTPWGCCQTVTNAYWVELETAVRFAIYKMYLVSYFFTWHVN